MANEWLRLWHDMPNDPKWRTIAKASGQSISAVIAVYVHLLVDASRNVTRGHAHVTDEDLASALDLEEQQVHAIRRAMHGRVLDGFELLGWAKRQPKREDAGTPETGALSSAERKRRQREREKAASESSDVTQSHEESQNVTLDKDKDKDKDRTTTSSTGDQDADAADDDSPPAASANADDVRCCPVGSLVDLYHELMPMNPQVKVLNEARKKAIRARWREASILTAVPFGYSTRSAGMAAWRQFFEVCSESIFLTGRAPPERGKPPFLADIDFIFSPSGFAKILENKYHRD